MAIRFLVRLLFFFFVDMLCSETPQRGIAWDYGFFRVSCAVRCVFGSLGLPSPWQLLFLLTWLPGGLCILPAHPLHYSNGFFAPHVLHRMRCVPDWYSLLPHSVHERETLPQTSHSWP